MWKCPACGTDNIDTARFCTECGGPRPAGAGTAPPPRRRGTRWVWVLVALAFLSAGAAVFLYTVHDWTPATCTEPETCRLCGRTGAPALGHDWHAAACTEPETCARCGQTRGEPLGHDAPAATCTEPSVCARCGQTLSPALGHDWKAATYDAPETCARCGQTRGDPKGWLGSLSGSVDAGTLSMTGTDTSHAYLLYEPVKRCLRITVNIKITDYSGNPFGSWGLYGRDLDGSWRQLGTFQLTDSAYNNYVSFPLTLEGQPSFDALCLAPLTEGDSSMDYAFYYSDVQAYVD